MTNHTHRKWRWKSWLLLGVLTVSSVAVVAIPVFLIMPFRSQTSAGIEWSFWLRRISFGTSIAALFGASWLCLRLWSQARWWSRLSLPLFLLPIVAATWFSRQNHFEWMFNPLPVAEFAAASQADFMDDREMVMAVEINGDAVAYPVRLMAYHHIVNDVVGGTPITATY